LIPRISIELVIEINNNPLSFFDGDHEEVITTIRGPVISGLQHRSSVIHPQSSKYLLGVLFRPGGACPILQINADELAGRRVSMRDVCGPDADTLHDRLYCARRDAERFAILDTYLTERLLRNGCHLPPRIAFALSAFRSAEGRRSVSAVADEIGWTGRHFSSQFAKWVGLTPRRYCRLRRLKQTLELRHETELGWASIAHDTGYADQSHMTNEFRRLVGHTPGDYATLDGYNPHHVVLPG
jgi:AraC-like DNA-binding protein